MLYEEKEFNSKRCDSFDTAAPTSSLLLGEYIFHVERTKYASVGVELRLTSKR